VRFHNVAKRGEVDDPPGGRLASQLLEMPHLIQVMSFKKRKINEGGAGFRASERRKSARCGSLGRVFWKSQRSEEARPNKMIENLGRCGAPP
jgi:hypothetical protein